MASDEGQKREVRVLAKPLCHGGMMRGAGEEVFNPLARVLVEGLARLLEANLLDKLVCAAHERFHVAGAANRASCHRTLSTGWHRCYGRRPEGQRQAENNEYKTKSRHDERVILL